MSSSDVCAQAMRTPRGDLSFVVLQGFLGGSTRNLSVAARSMIPVGTETSIFLLFPIFTMGLSTAVLDETFGTFELTAAHLCFVGVVSVSNPTMQMNMSQPGHSSYLYSCCIAVLLGFCVAAELVTLKVCAKRVQSSCPLCP